MYSAKSEYLLTVTGDTKLSSSKALEHFVLLIVIMCL